MATTFFGLAAILCYLTATATKFFELRNNKTGFGPPTLLLVSTAILSHSYTVYQQVITEQGIDLGFFNVASLMFVIIALFSLSAILRHKAIDNLTLALYPLAAIAISCSLWLASPYQPRDDWSGGLTAHILSSISAYGVMTLAAMQAAALALQDYALKNRELRKLIRFLPPLQTMEELLFELVWLGTALLSVAIVSGYLFVEDLFAQHLAHKTVFSLCAWAIFAILLWGRHQKGWRGKTAVKWTLGGFLLLMLAYFGSKFVLELLLQRP